MPVYQYLKNKKVIEEIRADDIAHADVIFTKIHGNRYGDPQELQWDIKRENKMLTTANGSVEAVQKAAQFAIDIQDACNLMAVINHFQRHLQAMREAGIVGSELNCHPVTVAVASKLASLSRMNIDSRETDCFEQIKKIAAGESVDYQVC